MITNAAALYGFPWVSPLTQQWYNANNQAGFLGGDAIHPTYYGYSVYASNLNNFMTASFPDWKAVNTNTASANFSASQTTGPAPLLITFSYTGSNGVSFEWSFGDGGTSSAQNPQYTYLAAGTFSVSLVVNGSVTQTLANLITVTNSSNQASATFSVSPTSGGVPTRASFIYTGTNGSSYAWSFGDGGTSTLQNPSYIYTSAGSFSPSLVVNGTVKYTLPSVITITNTASPGVSGPSLNVTNFGAVGDEAQVWVNTTSGSVVVQFTNALSSADIGKTIELFGVGEKNTGNNVSGVYVTRAQDLIDIITNVINGNAYVSGDIPTVTSNGVYCIYGSNDSQAFQAAVNAASGTNTVINIPVGRFLLIPPCSYTNFNNALPYPNYFAVKCAQGIILTKGGITFAGAGPALTALVAQGGFKDQGGFCLRGGIFNCIGPITNDYPLIWNNLTFDGGMQTAFTGNEGTQPANAIDGEGWDGSSYAGLDSGIEPLHIFKEFSNCRFQHFRGEMIKGITSTAGNETILVTNCVFTDGNATCFNYNLAHTISGCTFSNMYQIEEFYLKYPTNAPSYFVNNYATNIQHNCVSLNGGSATNEPYIIANNTFCQNGGNAIQTTPASNLTIVSNQFVCAIGSYSINIVLGAPGYQGYWDNSNILISANSFYNPAIILEIAGAVSPTDINGVENVQVCSNLLYAAVGQQCQALQVYNWCTNVHVFNNDFLTHASGGGNVYWGSGAYGYPYVTVDANDVYTERIGNFTGTPQTNVFSYGNGPRHQTIQSMSGDAFVLSDSDSNQIPPTAQMVLDNSVNGGTGSYNLYLNSAMTRSINVTNGEVVTASWVGGKWITTTGVANNPAIQVSSGTLAFGAVPYGTISERTKVRLCSWCLIRRTREITTRQSL
jgi:PKD repeat protein